jgi:hypothetical protein
MAAYTFQDPRRARAFRNERQRMSLEGRLALSEMLDSAIEIVRTQHATAEMSKAPVPRALGVDGLMSALKEAVLKHVDTTRALSSGQLPAEVEDADELD